MNLFIVLSIELANLQNLSTKVVLLHVGTASGYAIWDQRQSGYQSTSGRILLRGDKGISPIF